MSASRIDIVTIKGHNFLRADQLAGWIRCIHTDYTGPPDPIPQDDDLAQAMNMIAEELENLSEQKPNI